MNPFARVVTMLTMFIGRVGPVSLAIGLSARKDSAAARRAVQPQAHINVCLLYTSVQRAVRHMAITHINQASRGKEQKADGNIPLHRHPDQTQ